MKTGLKPFYVAGAFLLIAGGLVMWPLPVPLGLPMIALGSIILLRNTWTGRRLFVRMSRRFPETVRPVRQWLRRQRDKARQVGKGVGDGPGGVSGGGAGNMP